MHELYKWPDQKKCAVAITFDYDAESPYLWRNRDKDWAGIGEYEQRKFGPRQAIDRILDLLEKWEIKATFFIPGYVAEQYPETVKLIHSKQHEIGLHGYLHERVDEINEAEIEEAIIKSKRIFQELTGAQIRGYRSPSWEITNDTLKVLKRSDILYDSSLMGYDHPYWINDIPELPVQWLLDDVVYYRHVGGGGRSTSPNNPMNVIDLWKQEFLGLKEYGGLFMLTMHPWVSGRGSRLMALENLFRYLKEDPDIWWATCKELAEYHQQSHQDKFREYAPNTKELNRSRG